MASLLAPDTGHVLTLLLLGCARVGAGEWNQDLRDAGFPDIQGDVYSFSVLAPSNPYFLCQDICEPCTAAFSPQSEVNTKMQVGETNMQTVTRDLVQKQLDHEGRSERVGMGGVQGREFWELEVGERRDQGLGEGNIRES